MLHICVGFQLLMCQLDRSDLNTPRENQMDEKSILQIYEKNIIPLYEYVSRRCGGDRSLAEDVTQEAWLRAVVNWRRKGIPEEPVAWLKTVARNLLLNYFRRVKPVSLDSLPAGWEPGRFDDGFETDSPDTAILINKAMALLKPAQAHLLEAFHFEGMKVSEIAATLGISERGVEGRLRRSRISLRRHLETFLKPDGVKT